MHLHKTTSGSSFEFFHKETLQQLLDILHQKEEFCVQLSGVTGCGKTVILTELYNEIQRINNKNYPTKVGSLVSCTDSEGKRMYKMKAAKPPIESLAYTVYEKFGAKLEDVLAKSGDKNGQA